MSKRELLRETYSRLLLRGARLVDPQVDLDAELDLLLEGDKIISVGKNLSDQGARVVELPGALVVPGLVDVHVHLREPGQEIKEDIVSGGEAAAAGGYTAVCAMPNTVPVVDNRGLVELVKERGRLAPVEVYPLAAITLGQEGKTITEMADLAAGGAVGFSDDGRCVKNSMVMRNAMKYAQMLGRPVVSHTQDDYLFGDGVMHEGEISTRLGLPGIPALAEEVMTARELLLAEHDGTAVHLAHVSTARSVQMIRAAKARGVRVTAEATPHHFTLDHTVLVEFNSHHKMSPPLRTAEDVAAVKEGLADGTLDLIVTDHAPHTWEEKEREFSFAPFGIIGLETALALSWRQLVEPGLLSVAQWVERASVAPRRVFRLPEVRLEEGGRAELTLLHPDFSWTYRTRDGFSRSANSPFDGWEFSTRPLGVVAKGALVRPAGIWELANLG